MTDKKLISFLILIFLCMLPFFWLHQGLLLIDTGREFYIPQQMLDGGVLYKDIFNIYGVFSYQLNSLLFLMFGQKISVLALAGVFNSLLILITLFLLAREFLDKTISFLFTIFIMFALVFQTFLYNSNLTYCFAIVYALSAFLLSLLFLVKYTKTEKPYFAYLSCFFAGISIANKYEFALYLVVLVYALKNIGIKNGLKAFGAFISVPLISYGTLFFQGLNFNDVKTSVQLINNLVNAPLLKEFFIKIGLSVFHNRFFGLFAVLPILNCILLFCFRKEIFKNKPLLILVLSAIAASAKSFFSLNISHMGVFLLPICVLALIVMLKDKYQKFIPFFLAACILAFSVEDFRSLRAKNYFLNTEKGGITTYKKEAEMIKQLRGYIFDNTNPSDRVLILPEGCIINFITDRKTDNVYYNLSPLFYFDVFGEERILKHFEQNLSEYIIILPIDNREYGYQFFGKDYAQNFYEMIINNYDLLETANNIQIFKKKDIK